MKSFNKVNLLALKAELSTALAAFEKSNPEFAVTLGNCKYGETNCTFQLKVALKDEKGNALDQDRMDYLVIGPAIGLKKEWLDGTVIINGEPMKLVGYASNRRTRPVVFVNVRNGRKYIYTVQAAIRYCGGKPRLELKNENISDVINLAENIAGGLKKLSGK